MFNYRGAEYKIQSYGSTRFTNAGYVTRVYAINTTTGLGGRYFDIDDKGEPLRFSPD